MEILETAIRAEGSVGRLADALGVKQNVVSNWRARGLPKPWARVLEMTYGQKAGGFPANLPREAAHG